MESGINLIGDTLVVPDLTGSLIFGLVSHRLARIAGQDPTAEEYRTHRARGFFRQIHHATKSDGDYQPKYRSLMLLCTRRCNMACVYCYATAKINGPQMSVATALRATRKYLAASSGKVRISFHGGGEPTLNMPVLREVASYVRERTTDRGCSFSIVTNGTMGKETLQWLVDNRFTISLSWDGPADIQNRNRPLAGGGQSSERLEATAQWLTAKKYPFFVRATISPLDDIQRIVGYFSTMGAKRLHLEPLFPHGRDYNTLGFGPTSHDAVYAPEADELVRISLAALDACDAHGITLDNSVIRDRMPRFRSGRFCGNVEARSMVVTHDGLLTGCTEVTDTTDPVHPAFVYGNLELIDRPTFHSLLSRHVMSMKSCAICPLRYACGGGCAVKAFRITEDICGIDPVHCNYVKTIVPLLIKREAKQQNI